MLSKPSPGPSAGPISAEFNQRLASLEHPSHGGPPGLHDLTKPRVGRVAAGDEHDLRRRPVLTDECGEVGVLRHDHGTGPPRCQENVDVRCPLQVESPDGYALDVT